MATLMIGDQDDEEKDRLLMQAAENGLGSYIRHRFGGIAGDDLEFPVRSETARLADLS